MVQHVLKGGDLHVVNDQGECVSWCPPCVVQRGDCSQCIGTGDRYDEDRGVWSNCAACDGSGRARSGP